MGGYRRLLVRLTCAIYTHRKLQTLVTNKCLKQNYNTHLEETSVSMGVEEGAQVLPRACCDASLFWVGFLFFEISLLSCWAVWPSKNGLFSAHFIVPSNLSSRALLETNLLEQGSSRWLLNLLEHQAPPTMISKIKSYDTQILDTTCTIMIQMIRLWSKQKHWYISHRHGISI